MRSQASGGGATPEWVVACRRQQKAILARQNVIAAARKLTTPQRVVLRRIEEHLGRLSDWPAWAAEALLKEHLKYADRFTLTLFLLVNKCMPTLAAEWMLVRKMLKDHSARQHVASIIKEHMTGGLEAAGRTAYCMDATLPNGDKAPVDERVTPVSTPNFAKDYKHRHYWEDAINMLMRNTVQPVPLFPAP